MKDMFGTKGNNRKLIRADFQPFGIILAKFRRVSTLRYYSLPFQGNYYCSINVKTNIFKNHKQRQLI